MTGGNIKASFKKYLLALGFLISFFTLSGYVSQSTPGSNRVSTTEQFTNKFFVLKGGISYKRAALAFHTCALPYSANRKHAAQSVNVDNKLTLIRYQYLKRLFLSNKQHFAFTIDHLYQKADQGGNASSQIG